MRAHVLGSRITARSPVTKMKNYNVIKSKSCLSISLTNPVLKNLAFVSRHLGDNLHI
jgi:hypothetical protein